ncbi:YihY family inner membrane protein [Collimonas silvisoli]|uniref:YihY family inner membrane protein n=1 Tax=Collimonas silvisoli TaxID=2825884 RepID=UPI001B8ABED0|nr:YihY family inner membrane protein [Collimonas silvisoli]
MKSIKFSGLRGLSWSELRDLFRFAARRLSEERLPQVAGSLTFTTILALVPMLTIALAIFTVFPLFSTFRASLEEYFVHSLMPRGVADTILNYLSQFAAKSARLSAVGGVALIATAVLTMSTVDHVFNRIWRVKTQRPWIQRMMVYWAIITLGPLLIGISISVTSNLSAAANGLVMSWVGAWFYTAVSISLTTGAFTLLYVAVPNQRVNWRDAVWGGLLAGIAFEIAKRFFAAYVIKFPTYTVVYGTLAALPIFLLWIYMLWMITLVGALLAAALPVVKYERWWHVPTPGSAFVDAMAVLEVLYQARTKADSAAVDAAQIRRATRLGFDESESLLQRMLEIGWVGCVQTEMQSRTQWGRKVRVSIDGWILLANPEVLKLAEIYRLFVCNLVANKVTDSALAWQVEAAIEQGLEQTLAAYFEQGLVQPHFDSSSMRQS